jgi:Tfp pilus assembly protein PilO
MRDGQEGQSWHLDKRVPIALILAMAGQVAVIAWGAAVMFKDIEANREGVRVLSKQVRTLGQDAGNQAVQLGRIEESIRGLRGDVGRLLNVLEQRYRP